MSDGLKCEACGARVMTLRRGRCSVCYLRWSEQRPVGLGAACVVCSERRTDYLRLVEYQQLWLPMCHNCAGRTFRLHPLPCSIDALRQRLARDRRWRDRRERRPDHRILAKERRIGQRRAPPVGETPYIDWMDAEELIIEIVDGDEALTDEQTRIARPFDPSVRRCETRRTAPPLELTNPRAAAPAT